MSGYEQQQYYHGSVPVAPDQQGYHHNEAQQQPAQDDMAALDGQMANMTVAEGDHQYQVRTKKRDRHAYHNLAAPAINGLPGHAPMPAAVPNQFASPGIPSSAFGTPNLAPQPMFGSPQIPQLGALQPGASLQQGSSLLNGTAVSSAQGRVNPEQIPGVPWSRDAPAQYYLDNVYPTMASHIPPPASVPFVAVDQGNSSPRYIRLTMNNIPTSADLLKTTGLPLGLILQPLADQPAGEQPIPVVDFGDTGPPRCRRCRAYINAFMTFRSGGSKFVCNMCTFANDVPDEYFAPTDPSGARVDRFQRPELMLGTVDFAAPKEYWTKPPVPLRWLFLIDVSSEAISKGFLNGICRGILNALYPEDASPEKEEPTADGLSVTNLPPGACIGVATFDKEVHFYSLSPELTRAQMVVMPDLEDPFVPINEGLFVDPAKSKHIITDLLTKLPTMFSRMKNTEPALLPALNAGLDALKATGGKIVCSLGALPTWGPGRLFLREKPEMRDTDAEKKLFTTEHPGYTKLATGMTENGVGIDLFLAAPTGGYLDIATMGYLTEKTGGEIYYYPNFHAPRDLLRLSKELKHTVTRNTGFQALIKVRCSNGLQIASYFGGFTQHNFGADLEMGVIDADKAIGVQFSYDGKLDPKLDAHFQSALLYTSATGQRRIRCNNIVASVSESAMDSMRLVDQDAVVGILAKQAMSQIPAKSLKDLRLHVTERTIDILAAYRKNFSGSHPPGQLVLPENLTEFGMYMLGLIKSRALKAGQEPTDRRIFDAKLIKSMGLMELSLYLYPRIIAVHNLDETDGFPNENGHLRMPSSIRASYSKVQEGGVYLVDCGQICLLWIHANVSPNLLEDLFGEGRNSLQALDPFMSSLPVLETHLNAQVRNILQYLEENRGSKALTVQLARQGLDGAEYEFARLLFEDRNNEAQSYVDWLVHVHRHIQLEVHTTLGVH